MENVLEKILMSVKGLDDCEISTRSAIKAVLNNPYPWPGPRDQQNKADVYLSAFGVIYIIVRSKKEREKELR